MLITLILSGILFLYMLLNIARIFKGRINKEYLRHAWKKTALWLVIFQIIVILLFLVAYISNIGMKTGLYILATSQALVALIILVSTLLNLRRIRVSSDNLSFPVGNLPTLTVCIPARNETKDLHECLQSLVKSTYPKLEILVLDDCSQERQTPEIIREFAQDGVRFIAGKQPPERWLAKNFGYDQLADEANGELLLFCGVDTRFEPETITSIVTRMIHTNKKMLCILPNNLLKEKSSVRQTLIQPSRYAWELALPRNLLNRPPVLSTCWIITQVELESAGGFDAVSRQCVPESYFAKRLQANSYSFIASNKAIGLTCTKNIEEQRSTTIRTRYPQLHRRPELVALLSIAEFAQLVLPFIILITAFVTGNTALFLISLIAYVANSVTYSLIINLAYRRFILLGIVALPIAAIYDIWLLNLSMWKYEFGEVIWKDRNICLPVMQVFPELPKT